jgi:hypothetical protein
MVKLFCCRIALVSLPIGLLLFFVNYFGDCANLFNKGYEDKIIELRTSGNFVTNVLNYDERLVQKVVIEKMQKCPNFAVLGSSRSMLVNSDYLGNSMINLSVSAASIQDYIGIFWLLKKKGSIPPQIIINVDPWLLTENLAIVRWKSLEKEYNEFNGIVENNFFEKYTKYQQLFSISYFQCSLKEFAQKKSDPISTKQPFNEKNTIAPDGSLIYGDKYRNQTSQQVDEAVSKLISEDATNLLYKGEISNKLFVDFSKVLKEINKSGSKIYFFFAPYHPLYYDFQKKNGNNLKKFESRIRQLANAEKIEIIGSYDPQSIPKENLGFYDGIHCKPETISWILKSFFKVDKAN